MPKLWKLNLKEEYISQTGLFYNGHWIGYFLNTINIYKFITHSNLYFIENILLTEVNLWEYNILSAFHEVFVKNKRDTNADNGANKPKT